MSPSKKQPPKKVQQEPPAEQPQEQEPESTQMRTEEIPDAPPEPVRPMAVPPLTAEERIEALELRMKVTEEWTGRHNRYHFGK